MKFLLVILALCFSQFARAGSTLNFDFELEIDQLDDYWHLKSFAEDGYLGVGSDNLLQRLITPISPQKKIIVAVIDTGVDINHFDLAGKIWLNENEIPNNNIDDDNNGYVDDISGWNFLGNKNYKSFFHLEIDGDKKFITQEQNPFSHEQIINDNLEITRRLVQLENNLRDLNQQEYQELHRIRFEYERRVDSINKLAQKDSFSLMILKDAKEIVLNNTSLEELDNFNLNMIYHSITDQDVIDAIDMIIHLRAQDLNENKLNINLKNYEIALQYHYNKNLNQRSQITGARSNILIEKGYGNNDVIGPNPNHGTAVAGIIAADRDNELGARGVSPNVLIMPLRVVPNGDETDKDVINAIYYAVDNGANIINLSFAKYFSTHPEEINTAIEYAQTHNVLIIHAAGNEAKNIDLTPVYPTPNKENNNFIRVAASTPKYDYNLLLGFSNYGVQNVHLLAPGYKIKTLAPKNNVAYESGTSMSAAIISGLCALVLNLHDDLTPSLLKNILNEAALDSPSPAGLVAINQGVNGIPQADKIMEVLLPFKVPYKRAILFEN